MAWSYFIISSVVLAVAAFFGWCSRRFRTRLFVTCVAAAGAVMGLRVFLHAHPEYEQHLLGLSDDYPYFATWEAPFAALMVFGLAARLHSSRLRRVILLSLLLLAPLSLWNSLVVCLQPRYAMAADLDGGGVRRQGTDYSCGPAAGVTMLRLGGVEISEGEMAALCLMRPHGGVTALELCRGLNIVLRATSRRSVIQRVRPDDLDGLRTPFLAEMRRPNSARHCVVVLQVRADAVLVADPAQGRVGCAREDFLKEWTGLVITVEPF